MVEPLEGGLEGISAEDNAELNEIAFRNGPEGFLRGQVELMALYGVGLYDSAFRAELDRQIADFYSLNN
jgi:hypothetical protein